MGLLVHHPGLSTTIQDLGRPGYRRLGVPLGGAADPDSLTLANALVGNPPEAAALEFTAIGGEYEALVPLDLAIAGAPFSVKRIRASGEAISLNGCRSFPLEPGERLQVGGCPQGLRAYLAVRGGWQTKEILGSRSSETRLTQGEIIAAERSLISRLSRSLRPEQTDSILRTAPLRILIGPDSSAHWDALDHLIQTDLRVAAQSNRIGLRLEKTGWTRVLPPDRPSSPVAPGAIQFTGVEWLILGVAGGTMGGYPHIGQVISADASRLGQLRPGDLVRFQIIDLATARRLDRESRADSARLARIIGGGIDRESNFGVLS